MANRLIFILLLFSVASSAQITSDTKDYQVALKRLRIGTDTSKYFTQIVEAISAASTHRHSPTAKAVYDLCQSLLPTLTAGAGISITGASPNFTITNTGDTNASDDITTSSTAGGDISGPFSNLQIVADAVGTAEIDDGSIIGDDISQMSASPGQALIWNGSTWAPADVAVGSVYYQTANDEGSSVTQRSAFDFRQTANINFTLVDDSANDQTDVYAVVRANSLTDFEIATGAIGTDEIADGSITGDDFNDMGASPGDVLQYNGSTWLPAPASGGSDGNGIYDGSGEIPTGTRAQSVANPTFWGTARTGFNMDEISLYDYLYGGGYNGFGLFYADTTNNVASFAGFVNDGLGSYNAYTSDGTHFSSLYLATDGVSLGTNTTLYLNGGGQTVYMDGVGGLRCSADFSASYTARSYVDKAYVDSHGGTFSGSIAANQVAYGTGTNAIGGSSNLTWDGSALTVATNYLKMSSSGTLFRRLGADTYLMAGGGNASISGLRNIAIGNSSLFSLTSANNNIGIGEETGYSNTTQSDCIFIGRQAGKYQTGGSNLVVGSNAMIGVNGSSNGAGNIAIGLNCLQASTTGAQNTAIGANSLLSINTGGYNTAIGGNCLRSLTGTYYNTGIGNGAGYNSTGTGSTFIGFQAGENAGSGNYGMFLGLNAGRYNTGSRNFLFGYQCGQGTAVNHATGDDNILMGYNVGYQMTTGFRNIAIGSSAFTAISTGNDNICLGYNSNQTTSTGSSNIIIGNAVGPSSNSVSNEFRLASLLYGTSIYTNNSALLGLGVAAPAAKFQILGTGSTSSTYSLIATNSTGTTATAALAVRDDGKVGIGTNAPAEALDVNGQGRVDALDIRDWNTTDNFNTGEVHFETGSGSEYAYLTVGDGERRFPFTPKDIQLQAIDYNVAWTTGRTKAFWTVPARYAGWKIYSVTLMVSTIGTGTNTVATEKGGVAQATTNISSATTKIVLDSALATDDIWTWNVTAVSGTPTKGLFIEIILRHN